MIDLPCLFDLFFGAATIVVTVADSGIGVTPGGIPGEGIIETALAVTGVSARLIPLSNRMSR